MSAVSAVSPDGYAAGCRKATDPPTSRRPVADLRGVGRTFAGAVSVSALRGCDLQVREGEFLAIVGPSGAGKSTLLNILGLLDRPSEGRYELNGTDTACLTEPERANLRARTIGFVFQAFHLIPDRSCVDNVALPLVYLGTGVRDRRRRAAQLLERVGLGHRLAMTPRLLSGGERQRVAIARALVTQPALLLCDEPTGNLDSAAARDVLDLLDELHAAGGTVVVITHNREVSARAQRQAELLDGTLTC